MHDSRDDIRIYPALPLEFCGSITAEYDRDDEAANRYQAAHRHHASRAAVYGAMAVILAVLGLSLADLPFSEERTRLYIEGALLAGELLSIALLLITIAREHKYKWLIPRHRAELYRLVKFQILISPLRWNDDAWLQSRLKKIQHFRSEEALEHETRALPLDEARETAAVHESAREQPDTSAPLAPANRVSLDRAVLGQLIDYYLVKRLLPQKHYFAKRIKRNESGDRALRRLAPRLFFASVILAILHAPFAGANIILKWSGVEKLNWLILPMFVLAISAVCLPTVAAAVRTYRGAFELSRNKSRYRMGHSSLSLLELALKERSAQLKVETDSFNTESLLKELWWCEHILQIEHYEWLRLMVETEWYG